jgi:hypothetical protein
MRYGLADHLWRILRGRNWQVNENGVVGRASRGVIIPCEQLSRKLHIKILV